MYHVLIFCILLLNWLVFSGLFDVFHISLGVICCAFVTWLSSDLLFTDRSTPLSHRFREFARAPGYIVWLIGEVFKSNVHVLKLALSPNTKNLVRPRLIRIKTPLKSQFGRYVLANSITLTPGTVTVNMHDDELLIHCIDKASADGLDGSMDERIANVYEPEILDQLQLKHAPSRRD
ncbi:MAG: Na+/H+ antiporter subunit E [Verrucomicrobiota bacterium]